MIQVTKVTVDAVLGWVTRRSSYGGTTLEGETGILCLACAGKYAPELTRAVEHLYAPRHISGMDLGGGPIDVLVRAEMPLFDHLIDGGQK